MTIRTKGGVGPHASGEAKNPKKNQKKQKSLPDSLAAQSQRVTSVKGVNEGFYSYQDNVVEKDPIKERHVMHTMEYLVREIATPSELADGHADVNVDKGVATFFVPPTANTLGNFVGKKEVSTEFFNDSDQTIVVSGAWCKNWSNEVDTVDTVEPFRLEIPAMSSRKTTCKKQWNFPLYSADVADKSPARYLMMRYFVHSSDSWSEKFRATSLTDEAGVPTVDVKMKDVTAYRRVDSIHYYTTGGKTDDETATELVGYGTFYEFSMVTQINGTLPMPPMPYKMNEFTCQAGNSTKKIQFFGHPKEGFVQGDNPIYKDVIVDLNGTEKIGLGVYPVDYYDEVYGWAGMLTLCTISKEDIDGDKRPEVWKNTNTNPDLSSDSTVEWELPVAASLTLDETNDDMACVGGRFKYSDTEGCYVLWDRLRNKPTLVGGGYNSFAGDYIFYGPKCFTGKKTVIKGVLPGAFVPPPVGDGGDPPPPDKTKIAWGTVFAVVSTIIEVLYVASQALGHHFKEDKTSLRMLDPVEYSKKQMMIAKTADDKLSAFMAMQEKEFGKLRPRDRGYDGEGGRRRKV